MAAGELMPGRQLRDVGPKNCRNQRGQLLDIVTTE
jgi:hypothetical protein